MSMQADSEAFPVGDPQQWHHYFDDLELALHDFEVALSRREVEPLRLVPVPGGAPPDDLRGRWLNSYQRLSELEFRAVALREDMRLEMARLNGGRRAMPPTLGGYGTSIDITG